MLLNVDALKPTMVNPCAFEYHSAKSLEAEQLQGWTDLSMGSKAQVISKPKLSYLIASKAGLRCTLVADYSTVLPPDITQ